MQTQSRSSYHGSGCGSRGPEIFYGYCHETGRMRMMDYGDYVSNLQTGYSNLYSNPAAAMQPMVDAFSNIMRGMPSVQPAYHYQHGCRCGHDDCACSCCIRCADVIEYARCGEVRRIPITFDNDTRRERDVTLQLGNFVTESGLDVGWTASVAPTAFKLAPCGETTVLLSVNVDCSKLVVPPSTTATPGTTATAVNTVAAADLQRVPTLDGCKVAYATLRAEGCSVRPLVIAIAVLPEHCGAHHACCGCGCCCN